MSSFIETTANGVLFCIKNKAELMQRAELTGKMENTVDVILDAERILEKAELTTSQKTVLQLSYKHGLTLKEVGSMLGISFQAVGQSKKLAKAKIQKVIDDEMGLTV